MTEAEIRGSRFAAISRSRRSDEQDRRRFMALKRAAMAGVTAVVTANIWTGCPLLALWVGSHAAGSRILSMAAVGVVLVVLAVLEFAMVMALAWLISVYDELTGRPRAERGAPWLRTLCRLEAEGHGSRKAGISSLEGIVVINVYVAVITLAIWYVFFAAHPAPILCPIHC